MARQTGTLLALLLLLVATGSVVLGRPSKNVLAVCNYGLVDVADWTSQTQAGGGHVWAIVIKGVPNPVPTLDKALSEFYQLHMRVVEEYHTPPGICSMSAVIKPQSTHLVVACPSKPPLISALQEDLKRRYGAANIIAMPNIVVRAKQLPLEQANAPYHLDRLDNRTRTYDQTFHYGNTANTVDVYIFDTGIRATHQDIAGRVQFFFDYVDNDNVGGLDCDGHGTHVASLVGGSHYGVAKSANLIDVRVLDCQGDGSVATILEAIVDVCHEAPVSHRGIINLSLAAHLGNATLRNELEQVMNSQISQCGLVFVAAAGNEEQDACTYWPAYTQHVLAVAATDSLDRLAPFSNFGACVNIAAPGVGIIGAGAASNDAFVELSGTSQAAPLFSGALAVYWQARAQIFGPDAGYAAAASLIADASTLAIVGVRPIPPPKIVFLNAFIGLIPPPTPPPPSPPTSSSPTPPPSIVPSVTPPSPPPPLPPPTPTPSSSSPPPQEPQPAPFPPMEEPPMPPPDGQQEEPPVPSGRHDASKRLSLILTQVSVLVLL